jgi:hypothetical protein
MRFWFLFLLTAMLVPGARAMAMPGRIPMCARLTDTNDPSWRAYCLTRAWCATHWNDDRITRISCDPMRSHADATRPNITLSPGGLVLLRDLSEAETHLDCTPPFHSTEDALCKGLPVGEADDRLLPPEMKTAKLGLYARIEQYVFPATVVRLGIASANSGTITVSWNQNGNGPRVTQSARLNGREIADLIAALNGSNFWRSPHRLRHIGPADGEAADVAVGITGRQNQVGDMIGDGEAVDLSVLVNALSLVIRNHWRNVPGG